MTTLTLSTIVPTPATPLQVLVSVLQVLTEVYNEVMSGSDSGADPSSMDMIAPLQVGLQLVDWTDPSKAVNLSEQDQCLHFDVALELLQQLLTIEEKDERKVVVQLLNKLVMPDVEAVDASRGKTLFILCAKIKEVAPIEEASSRNALNRFELACAKRYPSHAIAAKECNGNEDDEDLAKLRAFLESLGVDALADPELIVVPPADVATSSRRPSTLNTLRKGSFASSSSTRSVSGATSVTSRRSVSVSSNAGGGGGGPRGRGGARAKSSRASVAPGDANEAIREMDGDEGDADDDEDIASALGDLTTDDE